MKCPKCSQENNGDAKFCSLCYYSFVKEDIYYSSDGSDRKLRPKDITTKFERKQKLRDPTSVRAMLALIYYLLHAVPSFISFTLCLNLALH